MAEERLTTRPMGRRGFLKTTGGLAVFGGVFVIVGCGDDDDDDSNGAIATAPGSAPTTAGGAASPTMAAGSTTESLYSRLGGATAITAVVDDFFVNVAADTRINKFFANTNLPNLKKLVIEQLGMATGGPEKYTGRDMKTTHAGLAITMADFTAFVEDLVKSLDKFKVPMREKNELLGALGPMSADIVTA